MRPFLPARPARPAPPLPSPRHRSLVFFAFPLLRKPRGIQKVLDDDPQPGLLGLLRDMLKVAWGSRHVAAFMAVILNPLQMLPLVPHLALQFYTVAMVRGRAGPVGGGGGTRAGTWAVLPVQALPQGHGWAGPASGVPQTLSPTPASPTLRPRRPARPLPRCAATPRCARHPC